MNPIVLIHGLFGSLRATGIISAFGGVTVLAPDLVGYGSNRATASQSWTLADQADHVASWLSDQVETPVHIVGHSVGGAVGVILAGRYPSRVLSLTSVEGNITLQDAFWSQRIAELELSTVEAEIAGFRADVRSWIGQSGVSPTQFALTTATEWIDNQPAATIQKQAQAVVAATADASYLDTVREILRRRIPVHLLAGARSRCDWSVPGWLSEQATSDTVIPGTGHLMMLERPQLFANAVLGNLSV